MEVINLTPHPITIVGEGGSVTLPPSGQLARVASVEATLDPIFLGGVAVKAVTPTFGEVTGLPPAEPGVVFLVSALVRGAVPDRKDVASPGALLRDQDGNVLGCSALQFN